jgi:CTP synthase
VQVIPHVTDEIKKRIYDAGKVANAELVLVEVGGTVGDIESLPFLEAIRQIRFEVGSENTLYLHVTLLPYLGTSEEFKTKPTQHSVATLRGVGIQPDGIVLRSKSLVPEEARKKIALFCNVEARDVFSAHDADYVYAVPEILEQQGIGRFIERRLQLEKVMPEMRAWHDAVKTLRDPGHEVTIAIVGKYVAMPDAYLVRLEWINAEDMDENNIEMLRAFDGILVPGGFGIRGIEGKVRAARFARENNIPYLGICLGLQVATIEFARHVAGLEGANSSEFDKYTPFPVIDLMPEQLEVKGMGGTMRLGNWPMRVLEGTLLEQVYELSDTPSEENHTVLERHRHRYEVNPKYLDALKAAGLVVSGVTPGMQGRGEGLVEAIELKNHRFFLGLQSHPELSSRIMRPSPPFKGFIQAAVEFAQEKNLLEKPLELKR